MNSTSGRIVSIPFAARMLSSTAHIDDKFDAVGEKSLEYAPFGSRFQFIRLGYFIKDEKSNTFGQIVSLKDGFTN